MNITSSRSRITRSNFTPGIEKYKGPEDGTSQPTKQWAKKVSKVALGLAYRTEVSGAENLPQDGIHVYAPNHPSYNDPLVLRNLVDGDLRTMAAIDMYSSSVMSSALSSGGAFPVNRERPSRGTIEHASNLLKEGANLGIFPEGGLSEGSAQLNPFKAGAATFAVRGEADSIVPLSIHYKKGNAPTREQKINNLKKGALAGGIALAGATLAGPAGLAATGVVVGAASGAFVGGKVASKFVKETDAKTAYPKLIAGAVGAAVGGLTGALTAPGLLGAVPTPVAASLVTAASTGATYGWNNWKDGRDVAMVSVAPPLDVKEAVERLGPRQAVKSLTQELHQTIGTELAQQTGVPYKETSERT